MRTSIQADSHSVQYVHDGDLHTAHVHLWLPYKLQANYHLSRTWLGPFEMQEHSPHPHPPLWAAVDYQLAQASEFIWDDAARLRVGGWAWGLSGTAVTERLLQERGSDMQGGQQRITFSLLRFLAIYTRRWGQDSTPPRPRKDKEHSVLLQAWFNKSDVRHIPYIRMKNKQLSFSGFAQEGAKIVMKGQSWSSRGSTKDKRFS